VDDPTKQWKFRLGDLDERKRWGDYQAAFETALERCSTAWAPWYVIPSNRNWFRNLAVAEILGDVLEELDPAYPPSRDVIPPGLKIT
jgi:polyphosphate kinase 2 (PPK2 family)